MDSCYSTGNCPAPLEWRLHLPTGQRLDVSNHIGLLGRWSALKRDFLAFERDYKGLPVIQWTQNNSHIPIIVCIGYLLFIHYGQQSMKNRPLMRLKPAFAAWNLFLSLFSILGASRLVPTLFSGLVNEGMQHTVCSDPKAWIMDGPAGLWLTLFIFSKIPELIDTVFLVVRKKPVIFLHWYHHFTVMLYCWHALHTLAAPGIWFASMNFVVHSIMYAYYFATNVGLYKYVQPIASSITTLQILQMVGGTFILIQCAYTIYVSGRTCHIDRNNLMAGLAMYLSYFALFAAFFVNKYLVGGGRKPGAGAGGEKNQKQNLPVAGLTQRGTSSLVNRSKQQIVENTMSDRLTQNP